MDMEKPKTTSALHVALSGHLLGSCQDVTCKAMTIQRHNEEVRICHKAITRPGKFGGYYCVMDACSSDIKPQGVDSTRLLTWLIPEDHPDLPELANLRPDIPIIPIPNYKNVFPCLIPLDFIFTGIFRKCLLHKQFVVLDIMRCMVLVMHLSRIPVHGPHHAFILYPGAWSSSCIYPISRCMVLVMHLSHIPLHGPRHAFIPYPVAWSSSCIHPVSQCMVLVRMKSKVINPLTLTSPFNLPVPFPIHRPSRPHKILALQADICNSTEPILPGWLVPLQFDPLRQVNETMKIANSYLNIPTGSQNEGHVSPTMFSSNTDWNPWIRDNKNWKSIFYSCPGGCMGDDKSKGSYESVDVQMYGMLLTHASGASDLIHLCCICTS